MVMRRPLRFWAPALLVVISLLALAPVPPAEAACILKHVFVSGASDGGNPALLQPSHWNDCHSAQLGVNGNLLQRDTGDTTYGTGWSDGLTYLTKTLSLSQGTLVAPAPAWSSAATWNDAGTTFAHIVADITDTASNAASLLLDLKVGGASKFKVDKTGLATFAVPPAFGAPLGISNGGTGATSFTAGSLVFAGASALTQDNTNIFFDDTNDNLQLFGGSVGASGTKVLALGVRGVAPTTSPADTVQLYVEDFSAEAGSASLVLRDERSGFHSLFSISTHTGYQFFRGASIGDLVSDGSNIRVGASSNHPLQFHTNNVVRAYFDTSGNLGLGSGATFGTGAAGVFGLALGTAPSTSPADVVQLWAADIAGAGTGGLNLRDEAGGLFRIGTNSDLSSIRVEQGSIKTDLLAYTTGGNGAVGTNTNHAFSIFTNNTNRVFLDTNGNVGIGTGTFGTSAATTLAGINGTAPTSSPADTAHLWVQDAIGAGTASWRARGEEGVNGWLLSSPNARRVDIIKKSADETVNNSTTLQNDDAILFSMAATETVWFELYLRYSGDATADLKITLTTPASTTLVWQAIGAYPNTGDTLTIPAEIVGSGTTLALGATAGTIRVVSFQGWVATAGTAGTVQFQWAQNSQVAADTIVRALTTLRVWRYVP